MGAQLYELTITANGEVRDEAGDLVSFAPIESRITVTEDQLRELGLNPQEEKS